MDKDKTTIKNLLELAWEIFGELQKYQEFMEYEHFDDALAMIQNLENENNNKEELI